MDSIDNQSMTLELASSHASKDDYAGLKALCGCSMGQGKKMMTTFCLCHEFSC